jgi:hypothetical protein
MFDEDFDSTRIKFDKDFQDSQYCTIYELQVLLTDKQNKISKTQLNNMNSNPVFGKTLQYAERFNKYGFVDDFEKGAQKGIRIRNILSEGKLDVDEESALINLLPLNAEEAFGLMPSLREKLSEETLQYYLDELIKLSKIN